MEKIGHPLFSRDVELVAGDKSVTVTIRHSKTDQVGKGTTITIPPLRVYYQSLNMSVST